MESLLPIAGPSVGDRGRMELPFERGKTNRVAAADVARVIAAVLVEPAPYLGRIYELTGPRSEDLYGVARDFSDALNREARYGDTAPGELGTETEKKGLPEHLIQHLVNMGELHRADRYDPLGDWVVRVTGQPAMSVREFASLHADGFGGCRS